MISNHNYGAPQNYHNTQEPVVDSSKGNVAISQFSTQKWALSSQWPEFSNFIQKLWGLISS